MSALKRLAMIVIVVLPTSLLAETARPAADFTLPDLHGNMRSLDSFRGSVVLLDFWASWCAPCRKSFPVYETIRRKHEDRLKIVAVSVDESEQDMRRFLESQQVSFTFLHDPTGSVAGVYKLPGMPTSFLIDADGNLVQQFVGFSSDEEQEIQNQIEALLAQTQETP